MKNIISLLILCYFSTSLFAFDSKIQASYAIAIFDENKKVYSILVFGYEVTEQVIAQKKNEDNMQVRERELEEKENRLLKNM